MDHFPRATSDPSASFPPGFTPEGVAIGDSAGHCYDQGASLDSMSSGINPCLPCWNANLEMISRGESTVGGTTANTVTEPGTTVDHELQALLIEVISQLADGHVGNSSTHPTSASSANVTSFHLSLPESPHAHTLTTTTIQSGNQFYRCSWYFPDSNIQYDHVAPNRSLLLCHLGKEHQVTGGAGVPTICHLIGSTMGSVCGAPVKRGNFPRHLDIHYPVRFHCTHCPAGTSFSRKDTWSKHVRNKHPQILS